MSVNRKRTHDCTGSRNHTLLNGAEIMNRSFAALLVTIIISSVVGISLHSSMTTARSRETHPSQQTPTPTPTPTPLPSPSPSMTPTPVPEPEPVPSPTGTPFDGLQIVKQQM